VVAVTTMMIMVSTADPKKKKNAYHTNRCTAYPGEVQQTQSIIIITWFDGLQDCHHLI
jgi:hypothetical protein